MIINIKLREDKDGEQFNALIHKVKFPGLILRMNGYKNNHFDSEGFFVDSKGRRMIFFEIYKPKQDGEFIKINVDFDLTTGSHGADEYFLKKTGTGKYKLIKRDLLYVS